MCSATVSDLENIGCVFLPELIQSSVPSPELESINSVFAFTEDCDIFKHLRESRRPVQKANVTFCCSAIHCGHWKDPVLLYLSCFSVEALFSISKQVLCFVGRLLKTWHVFGLMILLEIMSPELWALSLVHCTMYSWVFKWNYIEPCNFGYHNL